MSKPRVNTPGESSCDESVLQTVRLVSSHLPVRPLGELEEYGTAVVADIVALSTKLQRHPKLGLDERTFHEFMKTLRIEIQRRERGLIESVISTGPFSTTERSEVARSISEDTVPVDVFHMRCDILKEIEKALFIARDTKTTASERAQMLLAHMASLSKSIPQLRALERDGSPIEEKILEFESALRNSHFLLSILDESNRSGRISIAKDRFLEITNALFRKNRSSMKKPSHQFDGDTQTFSPSDNSDED